MADRPLYLMLKPPPAVARRIALLRSQWGIAGTYGEERFHVTLQPLGDARDFTAANLETLLQMLSSLPMEAFMVAFDRLHYSALVGSGSTTGLRTLQRLLLRGLATAGLPTIDYKFRPHVSLVYRPGPLRDVRVPRIEWFGDEVLLVRSVQGEGRHEHIARWPLITRQRSFAF